MRLTDQAFNRLRTLRTLCRSRAISRVELAQRTGLAKSTISALADELIGNGFCLPRALPSRVLGDGPAFTCVFSKTLPTPSALLC